MARTLLKGLLELVSAAGGQIDNRIAIQKLAYLLAVKGDSRFDVGSFEYHHYGPFSRELADALHSAVVGGLLEEERTDYQGGTKYEYKLTEAGSEWVDEVALDADGTGASITAIKNSAWRALELAATVVFLERAGSSPRNAAFARAIELKPETRNFRNEAEAVLDQLRL